MTDADTTAPRPPTPFSRLDETLRDLGFRPFPARAEGVRLYEHPELAVRVHTDTGVDFGIARVSHIRDDGVTGWHITFTGDTPDLVQVTIALAAVNCDPQGVIDGLTATYLATSD
ncbi:hypothetical protein [Longispora albida]|uniref:hypothetical protein n=1 Tax=Longispora albida TaxID=203523 RepID=UPI0003635BAD|nr:hypothetical protein [Longispora albida]